MENTVAEALREAGDITARRVPLSGAIKDGSLPPADVSGLVAEIECKNRQVEESKTGRYVRFDLEWHRKGVEEAKATGKPAVTILQPKGYTLEDTFAVMRTGDLLNVLGRLARYIRGD